MGSDQSFTKVELIDLLKSLKVDVFFSLYVVASRIFLVSDNQLIEDKICLNQLQLNESICLKIENVDESLESTKNYIISTATDFANYQMMVKVLPGAFVSLFIGYWIDAYPKHLKWILAIPALGGTIGSLITIYICLAFQTDYRLLLLSEVFRGFSGGYASVVTGVYTYITRKTPNKYRALRFTILEIFQVIAYPISNYLGGLVLTVQPWFANQPRNYAGVFIVSGVCSTIGFIWVLCLLNDADCSESNKFATISKPIISVSSESKPASKGWFESFVVTFTDIFNFNNVSQMIRTCTKKRPNGLRGRIWHSLAMTLLFLFALLAETMIGFPFAQKVYHWDAKYYSSITSIFMIMAMISMIFMPILIRKFKVSDTKLGLLGCISLISSIAIRGLWLKPTGFIVANICNVVSGLTLVAIRSFLGRMICVDESGQIYALLSATEASSPLFCSLFYSFIFHATISFYPGLVYLIVATIMIYPMVTMIWLDLTKSIWFDSQTSNNGPSDQSDQESSKSSIKSDEKINEATIN